MRKRKLDLVEKGPFVEEPRKKEESGKSASSQKVSMCC